MGEAKRRGTKEERIKNADFKCIICRVLRNSSERSDEHVIPDSLNGYYHIYNVCKECNSFMGATADSFLLNHKITELYRFNNKMYGKSRKLPNPFSDISFIKSDPNSKIRTEIDQNGTLTYKYIPEVKIEKSVDGKLESIHIRVDITDRDKVDSMRNKIFKRNNLHDANIVSEYTEGKLEHPELQGQWRIDTLKFRLGLLKIAYEFAVDSIKEYFNDDMAIKISDILKNADYERLDDLEVGNGFDTGLFEKLRNIIDIEKSRHILILFSLPQGLFCFIKLDDMFHINIRLSDSGYMPFESSIVGFNDFEDRQFTKNTISEILIKNTGETYIKIMYWFPDSQNFELSQAQENVNSSDFKTEYDSNGSPKIFQKNGRPHNLTWNKLLNYVVPNTKFINNLVVHKFSFENLDLYVKSKHSGNLYEFRGIEISKEIIKA